MKVKLFLSAFFLISFIAKSEDEFILNLPKHTNAQKDEMAPCRKQWGQDLVDCMEAKKMKTEIFRRNLLYLDEVGQRYFYFEKTLKNSGDYVKLAEMYRNKEAEWQNLWEHMTENEKQKFFQQKDIVLIASSLPNLNSLIKYKEDKEWQTTKNYLWIAGGTTVVAILIFTPAGPIVVTGAKAIASSIAAKASATTAAVTSSKATVALAATTL